ncbi:hypothetical protein, partial [Pseudanabaena sp. lw0831]|uniref:hypothetical protein n=1 Tax=Pseudanabaena sp. lw0831 TaxID=1357935 RepID=UPI001F224F74
NLYRPRSGRYRFWVWGVNYAELLNQDFLLKVLLCSTFNKKSCGSLDLKLFFWNKIKFSIVNIVST